MHIKKKKKKIVGVGRFVITIILNSKPNRSALMVEDGALSHKIDYVTNHINGSKVIVILLNGWILPIDGVTLGRGGACSLRRRLVY